MNAAREAFSTAEAINVVASLTYLGPEEEATIGEGPAGPLEFRLPDPGIILQPAIPSRAACAEVDLHRGIPVTQQLLEFRGEPQPPRFAHGLHEIDALAEFRPGGCDAPAANAKTSIVVAVSDGPDDIPLFTDVAPGQQVCELMRNGGQLVRSDTGLGVIDFRGNVREVVWPNGYSARSTAGGAELFGRHGEVIAREGYQVEFDAIDNGGPLWPCGDVELARPLPS